MSEVINVPKPEQTDYSRANFATEHAFLQLIKQARQSGLQLQPVMGLMYLPTQKLTRDFQEACRAILESLKG